MTKDEDFESILLPPTVSILVTKHEAQKSKNRFLKTYESNYLGEQTIQSK